MPLLRASGGSRTHASALRERPAVPRHTGKYPREELNLHRRLRRAAPSPLDHGDVEHQSRALPEGIEPPLPPSDDGALSIGPWEHVCRRRAGSVSDRRTPVANAPGSPSGAQGSRTPHSVLARHRSDPSGTPFPVGSGRRQLAGLRPASCRCRLSCGGWIRTTVIRFQGPALLPLNYPAVGNPAASRPRACKCVGQELNLHSDASGLRPLGLANAQPTHSRARSGRSPRRDFKGVRADSNRLMTSVTGWPLDHFGIEHHLGEPGALATGSPVSVPWVGFEPTVSWLRTKRPLRAGTARASRTVAQVGFEPTASLGLNEGGLPGCLPSHFSSFTFSVRRRLRTQNVNRSGRRGGRTLKACFSSAVFETAAIAGCWLALPFLSRQWQLTDGSAACLLPLPTGFQSGWLDSNQRRPAPEAGG